MSLNKLTLIGRLGKNPEFRTTETGKDVCTFSVATSEKSGDKEFTTWHNIVVWGKLAGVCNKFLSKGREVYLEGPLRTREYEGKDGTQKRVYEMHCYNMVLIGNKPDGANGSGSDSGYNPGAPGSSPDNPRDATDDDDLPF